MENFASITRHERRHKIWSSAMSYSIFFRKIDSAGRSDPEVLACEIESEGEACKIVQSLASSFGEFGLDLRRSVYWFRNTRGLHEIWSAASD